MNAQWGVQRVSAGRIHCPNLIGPGIGTLVPAFIQIAAGSRFLVVAREITRAGRPILA
jgi:orotidine-5'-phosphate decarboxylase